MLSTIRNGQINKWFSIIVLMSFCLSFPGDFLGTVADKQMNSTKIEHKASRTSSTHHSIFTKNRSSVTANQLLPNDNEKIPMKNVPSPVQKDTTGNGSVSKKTNPPTQAFPSSRENNPPADKNNIVPNVVKPVQPLQVVAQPVKPKIVQRNSSNEKDIYLLARLIHAEARGEPLEGQVGVGAVLLNRLRDPRFPKTLSQIIFKRGEFCTVRDGQIWMNPNQQAIRAARLAMAGWDPTGGAVYFFNPSKSTSRWIWTRPIVQKIGNHVFAV